MAKRHEWTGETLAEGVRSGDRRALARAITLVENADPLAEQLVRDLYPETGRVHDRDHGPARGWEVQPHRRPDPPRPRRGPQRRRRLRRPLEPVLSGSTAWRPDPPLRPLLTRRCSSARWGRGPPGRPGRDDPSGDAPSGRVRQGLVFLETVGAGQSEVEVIGIADTVVLVLMPGSGDSVQALKAGIMEIPDVSRSTRWTTRPRGRC